MHLSEIEHISSPFNERIIVSDQMLPLYILDRSYSYSLQQLSGPIFE